MLGVPRSNHDPCTQVIPSPRLTWASPQDKANKDRHSRVTFDIEPVADMVRLTITHDQLEPGSDMLRGISEGWPRVLSSLKSLLETGRPLQTWSGR